MPPDARIVIHQPKRPDFDRQQRSVVARVALGLLISAGGACSPNAPTGSQDALVKRPSATTKTKPEAGPESPATSFREAKEVDQWMIVNDGVMGGKSASTLRAVEGTAAFSGTLSAENNGGFASIRTTLKQAPSSGLRAVAIRVRGDGNRYQFRVRTSARFDGPAYVQTFDTEPGTWNEIILPLRDFQSSFRGRAVPGASPLASEDIKQWGFLISGKQFGEFELEIEDIKLL